MPKKRVVTNFKPMRFETTYGTSHATERQQHAEEREAKRWLETRFTNARKLAEKYELGAVDKIGDCAVSVKVRDLMAMKTGTTMELQYSYDGIVVRATIERLP